jgi:hypothetical protein
MFLSQFYITFKETRHLDGKHVVFGRLVSGLAVLRKIAAVDTNSQDCPRTHVTIERCGSIQLLGDGEQVGRRCSLAFVSLHWLVFALSCSFSSSFRWKMIARKGRLQKQKNWKRGLASFLSRFLLFSCTLILIDLYNLFILFCLFRVAHEMEEHKKRLRETDPQESLKVGLQTLANKSQKMSAGVAAALAALSASDSDSD